MGSLSRHSRVIVCGATAIAVGLFCGFLNWPQPHRTIEFSTLILAAVLSSGFAPQSTADGVIMPPAFVFGFATLLLFGPHAATLVAAAGVITQFIAEDNRSHWSRTLLNLGTPITALQAAGLAHLALGGTFGDFTWPLQGVPISAAVGVYVLLISTSADVVTPLLARQRIDRRWPKSALSIAPPYFIGASLAVALVEVFAHGTWQVLLAAALPVGCAYVAYCDYVNTRADERRRRDVIDSRSEAMCVLDSTGRVTFWEDALDRLVGCPRRHALGSSLFAAVPALGNTELKRAIEEAVATHARRTVSIGITSAAGMRVLQVNAVPVRDGVTLLWHDLTERMQVERALKRNEERLALAAQGANDGWWEWDLRTQEFYVSRRWRAMLGLPDADGIVRPEEWTDRVHPEDIASLKQTLDAHLSGATEHFQHEHRLLHEDGAYRWCMCRGVAVRGAGRRAMRIAGSLTDTTERAISRERLRTAGFVDPLTGLCNRAVFVEGLGRRLEDLKERRVSGWFAVLYLDLDRFKVVNDSLGHLVGDELLIAVSRRLESCLRAGDALARLGGDEFAILLHDLDDEQQANAIAFRIQESLSAPFSIGGREVFTSASIGIAFGVAEYASPDDIMRDADTAMYHAKSRGKARHELFDADMHARARIRLGLENDLRRAINGNDFEVHYQPIVSLATRMCVGFESLVRWNREGEAISPATFVPIAEELGLIEPLGTWVLQQACSTFAEWQRRFPNAGIDCITVNASSRQLMQQNFVRLVEHAVEKSGLRPCDLRIEITETALMDSPNVVAEVLRELRDFGVKIYLDDFGTGYSSLSHLHKLPVDALKIDRSFVRSLLLPERPAIVESILGLARTLNTSVVAEGIESDVQARELERLGCTHAQGFLFSRPLSPREVEKLLTINRPLGQNRGDRWDDHEGNIVYPPAAPAWQAPASPTAGV